MSVLTPGRKVEFTSVLISPDRELASAFTTGMVSARVFEVLADLKNYLPEQTLEMRLRQYKPNILIVDVASNIDEACATIEAAVRLSADTRVVALHHSGDPDAILRTVRAGAVEFLHAPFDPANHAEALERLARLCRVEEAEPSDQGTVALFSSVKPGSGASTLATQTAFAIKRLTGKRVLLVDLDLTGGTIGFYLKLAHPYSLVDALQHAEHMDSAIWSSLVVACEGVDILPAPAAPYAENTDLNRLHLVLEYARNYYDWVILDSPAIFQRISLVALAQAERAFLVSTSELPSLHLARKAVAMLEHFSFPKERFQIVVNRINKKDGIGSGDMEKLFNCSVHASFPNDYFSLHRVVTLGQPLGSDGELGKAIDHLANNLRGQVAAVKKSNEGLPDVKLAFSVL